MVSTQEEILKAAVELFSEKGYEQTTIRDICHRAKANVAAVNYHFKGKNGLGDAVIDLLFENIPSPKADYFVNLVIRNEQEWKQAISHFIYEFIKDRDKEEYRNFYRSQLIFRELNNPSELFNKMYSKYMAPFLKQLIKFLRLGLPADAPDELVSMWVVTIMSQCVIFRKKHSIVKEVKTIDFSEPEKVKMVAEHIAGTVFSGLKFRADAAP